MSEENRNKKRCSSGTECSLPTNIPTFSTDNFCDSQLFSFPDEVFSSFLDQWPIHDFSNYKLIISLFLTPQCCVM